MASLQHQRIITVFFIRLLLWHVCWLPPHGLNDPHGILTPQGIRHTTTQKEGAPGFICPLPDFRFPPQPHQRSKERAGIPTDSQLPSKQKWRRRRRGLSSPPPRASPTHPSLPHDFALSLNVQAPPRVSFLTLAPSVSFLLADFHFTVGSGGEEDTLVRYWSRTRNWRTEYEASPDQTSTMRCPTGTGSSTTSSPTTAKSGGSDRHQRRPPHLLQTLPQDTPSPIQLRPAPGRRRRLRPRPSLLL